MVLKNNDQIHHLMNALTLIPSDAEDDFMNLGRFLQTLSKEVTGLVEQTSGSAQLLKNDDENMLDTITEVADSTLQSLDRNHFIINDSIQSIIEILKHLNQLSGIQQSIGQISRYLNAVAFNFVVETSTTRLKDENFSILADEVKQLAQQIHEVATRIKQDTESSTVAFSQTKDTISKRLMELETLTREAKHHLKTSIADTGELINLSGTAIEQSNTSSGSIKSQVGNIIVAVQLHDNIRQRIEHINQGLEDVYTLCSTDEPVGQREYSGDERPGLAFHILQVQASQLEDIILDLDSVFAENSNAFGSIIQEIDEFLTYLSSINGKNSDTDMTAGITASLGRINALKTKGETMLLEVEKTAARSLETSEKLSGYIRHIHTINRESRTKALNAIIAADRLENHGATFKVLAREMRLMTDEIDDFTTQVEEVIKVIDESSKKVNSNSESVKIKKEESLSQTISISISDISRTCDRVNTSMGSIQEQGEHIKSLTGEVIGELSFFKNMTQNFRELLTGIKELKNELEPFQQSFTGSLIDDPYFSARYTMEKERNIHKKEIPGFQEDSLESSTEADEDFSDNIELF